MKKLMKRSKKGFTLVELIVVIAILAILAGVAIPVYSGYITKANEASDMTQLGSVKTAVDFVVTEKTYNTEDGMQTAKKIVVTKESVTVDYGTLTNQDISADVAPLYNAGTTFSITFKSGEDKTATWQNGTWTIE